MCEDRARDIEKAKYVDIELLANFDVGHFFYRADQAVACVIDEDIDFAKAAYGFAYGFVDIGLVCDIKFGCDDLIAELGFEIVEDFGFASGGNDVMALFEEFFGEDASESDGGTGYEPSF